MKTTLTATPDKPGKPRQACIYLGLYQIIGNPKANPTIQAMLPVCRTTWYNGIRAGIYPPPIKHGRRSLWRQTDILDLLESLGGDNHD